MMLGMSSTHLVIFWKAWAPPPNRGERLPFNKSSYRCQMRFQLSGRGGRHRVHYKTPSAGSDRSRYNLNPTTFPVRDFTGANSTIPPHIETLRRLNIFFSIGQTF